MVNVRCKVSLLIEHLHIFGQHGTRSWADKGEYSKYMGLRLVRVGNTNPETVIIKQGYNCNIEIWTGYFRETRARNSTRLPGG